MMPVPQNQSNKLRSLPPFDPLNRHPGRFSCRVLHHGELRPGRGVQREAVVSGGVDPGISTGRDLSAFAAPRKDGTEFVPTSLPGMVLVGCVGDGICVCATSPIITLKQTTPNNSESDSPCGLNLTLFPEGYYRVHQFTDQQPL